MLQTDDTYNIYSKKVDAFSHISADIEVYAMCQRELNYTKNKPKEYANLKIQCMKYPIDLDGDLFLADGNFDLDPQTHQKILAIINRKDYDVLDQQSIALTKQVLDVLTNQLLQEKKKLGFQQ